MCSKISAECAHPSQRLVRASFSSISLALSLSLSISRAASLISRAASRAAADPLVHAWMSLDHVCVAEGSTALVEADDPTPREGTGDVSLGLFLGPTVVTLPLLSKSSSPFSDHSQVSGSQFPATCAASSSAML